MAYGLTMKTRLYLNPSIFIVAALAACTPVFTDPKPDAAAGPEGGKQIAALPPAARAAPQDAQTVEQFDTTTASERAAAETAVTASDPLIGRTIASLGDPAAGGFWLETPLVSTPQMGSVKDVKSGASVALELRPIEGATSAGSRISLAAMRVLEVALTDLPELDVYGG